MTDPCAICSNLKCANGILATWWDQCVDSKFTLFPTIYSQLYYCPTCKYRGKDGGWCSMYRVKPSGLTENGNSCGLYKKADAPDGAESEGNDMTDSTVKYISRDDAIAIIMNTELRSVEMASTAVKMVNAISDFPAADVAPVVRCKDCDRRNKSADLANTVLCKWLHNITMNKTDFCSYGIIAKCSAQWESKNYQDEQDGQPFNMEFHVCTNCGKKVFFNFEKTDECPQCHARMDGGENHDQR